MEIKVKLNGKFVSGNIAPDMLIVFLRDHGCYSVKRGCETSNCGLCTVLMDQTPVLSCSVLAARADGHEVQTLEGLQDEAAEFAGRKTMGKKLRLLFIGNSHTYYNVVSATRVL